MSDQKMSKEVTQTTEPSYAVDGAAGILPTNRQVESIVNVTARALVREMIFACKSLSNSYSYYKLTPTAEKFRSYTAAYNRCNTQLRELWDWADKTVQEEDLEINDSRRFTGNVMQIKQAVVSRGLLSPDEVKRRLELETMQPVTQPTANTSDGAGTKGLETAMNKMQVVPAIINTRELVAECGLFKGPRNVLVAAEFMQQFEGELLRQTCPGHQVSDASKMNLFRLLLTETAAKWHDNCSRRAAVNKPAAVAMFRSWDGTDGYRRCFLKEHQSGAANINPYEASRLKGQLAREASWGKRYSNRQEELYFLCERYSCAIHMGVDNNAKGSKIREDTAIELFLLHCEKMVRKKLANILFEEKKVTTAMVMEAIQRYNAHHATGREDNEPSSNTPEGSGEDVMEDPAELTSEVQKQSKPRKRRTVAINPVTQQPKQQGHSLEPRNCFYCKKPKHLKWGCRLFSKNGHLGYLEYKRIRGRPEKAIIVDSSNVLDEDGREKTATVPTV